jgi:hypothetical protein
MIFKRHWSADSPRDNSTRCPSLLCFYVWHWSGMTYLCCNFTHVTGRGGASSVSWRHIRLRGVHRHESHIWS